MSENPMNSETVAENTAALWTFTRPASVHDIESLDIPVVFRQQPRPLDVRRRVAYRTALLALVLASFNANAANVENVHLFMWATRTRRTRQMLKMWWIGRRFAGTQMQRIDPDLQITISLAAADGLVGIIGSSRQRIKLSGKGVELVYSVRAEPELLRVEKEFLASFPRLSDAAVARHLGGGGA
ncbi:hypothetical protein ACQP00_45040 [Dactylosporangium sp. CS-047395]|uniref:hypothetical protein n=1 Tax=Dactylosporangium sp. CS-047395 TaxID=3239936 RepID=UPI003D9323B4